MNIGGMLVHFLNDALVLSALLATLLPLFVSFVATGAIGTLVATRVAGIAVILAFIIAYVAILGSPPWPPRSSLQKIVYVSVIGLLVGAVLEPAALRKLRRPLALIWPGVLVAWFGSRHILNLEWQDVLVLTPLWLGGAVMFDRLVVYRDAELVAPTMMLAAGIGTSLVAVLGSAAALSQLAAVVAAATGGFLLWNWPKRRYPFSVATLFGAASTLFSIIVTTVLFTRSSIAALAMAVLVFLIGALRDRSPTLQRPIVGPVAFGLTAAVPMLLMIGIAHLTQGPLTDG